MYLFEHPATGQGYGRCSYEMPHLLMCFKRLPPWLKRLPQPLCSHTNGFSPVCVLAWFRKLCFSRNCFSHTVQEKIFLLSTTVVCVVDDIESLDVRCFLLLLDLRCFWNVRFDEPPAEAAVAVAAIFSLFVARCCRFLSNAAMDNSNSCAGTSILRISFNKFRTWMCTVAFCPTVTAEMICVSGLQLTTEAIPMNVITFEPCFNWRQAGDVLVRVGSLPTTCISWDKFNEFNIGWINIILDGWTVRRTPAVASFCPA